MYFNALMKGVDTIVVLDFGGQYTHLIANRIRRLSVFSEILPCDTPAAELKGCKGIILSGGPYSVLDRNRPAFDADVLRMGIPILGLCYGHQLIARELGGGVVRGGHREYGTARMKVLKRTGLLAGLGPEEEIWMSHGDGVQRLPEGFEVLGATDGGPVTAMGDEQRKIFGIQFHPEVTDTPNGMKILDNFLRISACSRQWSPERFLRRIEGRIQEACAGRKVFLLVSGGVDSTVAFTLLNRILGPERVRGLHIDNGLMRKDESALILEYMSAHGFHNLAIEHAAAGFLEALDGVADPERKRVIIGKMFLDVKEQAFARLGLNADEWVLGQGTIYPDTIESAGTRHADRIKTHHNRVDVVLELLEKGLVVEPLAQLYKDEVRRLGELLELPRDLLWRHPFPGPGLAVRTLCSEGRVEAVNRDTVALVDSICSGSGYDAVVLPIRSVGVQGDSRTYAHPVLLSGARDWNSLERLSTLLTNGASEVNRVVYRISGEDFRYVPVSAYLTRERLDKLREVDHIVTEALRGSGEYDSVWQMPVVLLPLVDAAGRECVVLRPVRSREAMTARFEPLRDETLDAIVKQVRHIEGVGDLFFDITHKPPATIEWE